MKIERPYEDFRRRFILFLLMSTFLLPANILGVSFKKGHEMDLKYTLHKTAHPSNVGNNVTDEKTETKGAVSIDNQKLSWSMIASISIISVIATYVGLLWTSYLKDQPMDKQCLMNNICRDLINTNTLYCWFWTAASVTFKIFKDHEQNPIRHELAKYLALMNEAIFLIMMMYICLAGVLRLYTLRFQVLDPLEEWFGEREKMTMICVRLSILSMTLFFVSMLHLGSIRPLVFYKVTKPYMTWEDTPLGSLLLSGFNTGLCVICGILFIASKIYQNSLDSKLQVYHIELGTQGNSNVNGISNCRKNPTTNEETSRCAKESQGALAWAGRVSTATLYIVTAILLNLMSLLIHLDVIYIDIWWGVTGMVGILGVVNRVALIFWYRDLTTYCLRKVKGDINDVVGLINGFISTVKKLRSRIAPIQ
jgi:hypothetical protein